jgi:hypothetical protein
MSAAIAAQSEAWPAKVRTTNTALTTPRRSHGDREGRPGHGRRVVDAVADHRHLAVAFDELVDGRHLLGRQQLGPHLVNAGLPGDGLGRPPVVAGQDDDVANPGVAQGPHHARRLLAHRVGDGDQAADVIAGPHHHRGTAGLGLPFEAVVALGVSCPRSSR